MPLGQVPPLRVQLANDAPVAGDGEYVLYWMIAARRSSWNFALDRALDWARELRRPLVVLEALRVGYRWASDRLHRFVLEGMRDNAADFESSPVLYYPYVEPEAGAGSGLLAALARRACVVVTDDYPCFFLPQMVASAAARLPVRLETVDSNGLLPLRATDNVFPTAYAFRRFLQKQLPDCLTEAPRRQPLARLELPRPPSLAREIRQRWPPASAALLAGENGALAPLPIDHSVPPATFAGGAKAARRDLKKFLRSGLADYLEDRNHPDLEATSGLSPYLHFGHISAHEIFHALMHREGWSPERLSDKASGKRSGWWGVSAAGGAFLDQLVTWRELGFNLSAHRADYDRYESLPDWAQKTLAKHAGDARPQLYTFDQLERAATYDRLWNAAQRQLLVEGRLHNYLRMLWGKKILQWTASPQQALEVMIELNNKYAVDGRDPNSYSGIFWILGRYDRAWGPERPIFGTIRYMSSENTLRKLAARRFLEKYAPAEP
jgi:deoxyribodipyrimidine photo-lyase